MSRRFSHLRLPDPLMSSPAPAWPCASRASQDGHALFLKHLQFHPKGCLQRWRPTAESLANGLDRSFLVDRFRPSGMKHPRSQPFEAPEPPAQASIQINAHLLWQE
jgi:hypothetical protein